MGEPEEINMTMGGKWGATVGIIVGVILGLIGPVWASWELGKRAGELVHLKQSAACSCSV